LARVIVDAIVLPDDPRTLSMWAWGVGVGRGTIREWCQAAGVKAKDGLALTRLLRAVHMARLGACHPGDLLDIVDDGSRRRLLQRGALCASCVPTAVEFLSQQTVVVTPSLVAAIERMLSA
jgi:hypothetical protein